MQLFALSEITLLLYFILPFLFFGFHATYWYRPGLLKQLDFLLCLAAILLSTVIFSTLLRFSPDESEISKLLVLLHLAPLVLTLLIVSTFRGFTVRGIAGRQKDAGAKSGDYYSPVPLNKEIERLSWDDIIINTELRDDLLSIIQLLKDTKTSKRYGIDVPKGILLSGPPGTGKTMIAKVIANQAGLSFFVLKLDEVISKWVGESEKNLTKLFKAASRYAPSVIFIDEIDSIGRHRTGETTWADNLLNHLLQLVDGVIKQEGLYIIGATNRDDLVDDALKRAGRLTRVIQVPLPDIHARHALFGLYLSKLTLEPGISLERLAQYSERMSGADIKEVCNQAGLNAFKRESGSKKKSYTITIRDLELAFQAFKK